MKQRCLNENHKQYPEYGGRGIKVCQEWLDDFLNFSSWADENGYEPHLTLDREDNNLDYNPENCRWENCKIQNQNRSTSKIWSVNGKEYPSLSEASEDLNISHQTISRWCEGYTQKQNGKTTKYPPKNGCFSRMKYLTEKCTDEV